MTGGCAPILFVVTYRVPLTHGAVPCLVQDGLEKKSAAVAKRSGKKVDLDETLWQKTQISVSWADCDDEDNEDAAAPPPAGTGP